MKDERGMTLIEVMASLFLGTLLFGIILSIYLVGMQKTDYIVADSEIVRFEQSISNWLEKDIRQNRIVSIAVSGDPDKEVVGTEIYDKCKESDNCGTKLILDTGDSTIEYGNRVKGFYRSNNGEGLLLTPEKVDKIEVNGHIVTITYSLQGVPKSIKIMLNK